MAKLLSCGILVQSPSGWLLAHATRGSHWDLPKGRQEEGETPLQTALRETQEETGLDLSPLQGQLVDLGRHPYIPKKDLHLFLLRVDKAFDLGKCECTSMIELPGRKPFPEADAFEWVPKEEVPGRIGKGLMAYFVARGLLPANLSNTARKAPVKRAS